ERIQRLQGECGRLIDVSNDFLQFARLQNLELQPGNLAEVVEDLVEFLEPTARQSNIEIKCYLPADLPAVLLNRDLFKQALLNLVLNSEQAMPNGGLLTIQAAVDRAPGDSAATGVSLMLIDTGKGMSPEVMARVFKPFFSTKPGGTGLGLPTTRKIIEAHNGTSDVQSEVGRGTKFTIRLPAVAKPCTGVSQAAEAADSGGSEGNGSVS